MRLGNCFGGLIDRLVHSDGSDALGHLERALERRAQAQIVDRVVDHVDGADLDDLPERRVRLVLECDDDRGARLLAVDRRQPTETCARPERRPGDENREGTIVLLHVIDRSDLRARNNFGVVRKLFGEGADLLSQLFAAVENQDFGHGYLRSLA